jgi:hypothetical protein
VRTLALALALVLAVLAAAPAAWAGRDLRGTSFQTPSRNIGCRYDAGALRCDILSGLRPEPRRSCELDWTGLSLGTTGRGRPTCAGDTAYSVGAPVLRYGRAWRRGGLTCLSRRTGLRCTSRAGHGFVLSRQGWRVY